MRTHFQHRFWIQMTSGILFALLTLAQTMSVIIAFENPTGFWGLIEVNEIPFFVLHVGLILPTTISLVEIWIPTYPFYRYNRPGEFGSGTTFVMSKLRTPNGKFVVDDVVLRRPSAMRNAKYVFILVCSSGAMSLIMYFGNRVCAGHFEALVPAHGVAMASYVVTAIACIVAEACGILLIISRMSQLIELDHGMRNDMAKKL